MRGFFFAAFAVAGLTDAAAAASPDEVIAIEREFAADAQARGWIAAFKKYAAPEAISFQPDPGNVQQSLANEPDEPADRSLKWWPIWGGIATSGDLGFTTGPYTAGETGYGHYFTVWAKQADGTWRWIFDGGPRNAAKSPLGPETVPTHLPPTDTSARSADDASAEVAAAERSLADGALRNAKSAYLAHLSPDARIMGSPEQPATTAETRDAELGRRGATIEFKPLGGRAAKSGELVFTYGQSKWRSDGRERRGHYVRIWQKRTEGWRIVFDEILLVPPKPPQ